MSRVTPTTPTTASPPTATGPPSQPDEPQYPIKWVLNETERSFPVVMQSANGPCALLALANALLLTHTISLPPGTTILPESHLMSLLAEHASSQPLTSNNHEHLLQEFLDLLPTLSKGLHINVKFCGAAAFEFTKELGAFDILKVRLLHGWLVDPQDAPLTSALGDLSYNQVLNELVRTASPEAEEASAPPEEAFDGDAPVIQESSATLNIRQLRPCVLEFFEGNPTMLTVYGLTVLHEVMEEGETAVMFRNSHFYVLRKKGGELYTLVTDVGYLNELNTVWEKLIDITGDSVFYTGAFRRIGPDGQVVGGGATPPTASAPSPAARPTQPGAWSRTTQPGARPTQNGARPTPTGARPTQNSTTAQAGSAGRPSGRVGSRSSGRSKLCAMQ